VSLVHVLLPAGVDDPAHPSGGNRYDRRLCDGLAALGWTVREHVVPGGWPRPDAAALAALARTLADLPTGALVVLDGLIASVAAAVLAVERARLRLVALVHMPRPDGVPGEADELQALGAMRAIVTTSEWTRERLVRGYGIRPELVHAAPPGVDPAPAATGTPTGRHLLAVGAVVPHKGQDLLLDALGRIAHLDWRCSLVGPLDRAPDFVDGLRRAAVADGRVRMTGALAGAALADAYASADLLVLPSRTESFGLVVLEALAAGLPVIGFRVGGVPEALGGEAEEAPGILVPPEDPAAFAAALGAWLTDPDLRAGLRAAAVARRATLPGLERTARVVSEVLAAVD